MADIEKLFENNRKWAESQRRKDPDFFGRLSSLQTPKLLWIGCSDSRVPANEILGLLPGDVFVHRNVANLVINTDINCLSVIQYAVDILKVEHIIVCGHYACGGVRAACRPQQMGLIDNWLRNIKDIYAVHKQELDAIVDEDVRINRLCELNVLKQVQSVCYTSIVQNAWLRKQTLSVHGFIYQLSDGILRDLAVRITQPEQIDEIYRVAV